MSVAVHPKMVCHLECIDNHQAIEQLNVFILALCSSGRGNPGNHLVIKLPVPQRYRKPGRFAIITQAWIKLLQAIDWSCNFNVPLREHSVGPKLAFFQPRSNDEQGPEVSVYFKIFTSFPYM